MNSKTIGKLNFPEINVSKSLIFDQQNVQKFAALFNFGKGKIYNIFEQ